MTLHFVVPGSLGQRTGGYLYDAHIISGLRRLRRDIEVHELPGRFPWPDDEAKAAALRALKQPRNDDVLVIDGLALPAFAEALPALPPNYQRRIIALIHHPLALETGLDPDMAKRLAQAESRVLAIVNGVICSSRHTAQVLRCQGIANIRVVQPAVERPRQRARKKPPLPRQLLCVGSLIPRKGQRDLLQALGQLRDLPWRLECVGSGERHSDYPRRCQSVAGHHRLAGRVCFTGELNDRNLDQAYARADLFVLPSYHEGYGMVLAEALARGLPTISTWAGAIPEVLPKPARLLVTPGHPRALAAALRRALTRPAVYTQLRRGADYRGRRPRSWSQAATEFATALDDLTK